MLTDKTIEKLGNDARKQKTVKQQADNDDKRGSGRLIIRAQPSGNLRFWFRYLNAGKWTLIDLGLYDKKGESGLSLAQARLKLQELIALRTASSDGDLKLHLQQIDTEQKTEAVRQKKVLDDEIKLAREGTLRKLLETYIAHLEKQGKSSAKDVRNLFRKNVFDAWPDLSNKKAAIVEVSEITDVLRLMISNGVGRNTAKLRSYIRAAYSLAMQAVNDPTIAASAQIFNLTHNPAASIPALSQFSRARDRTLDIDELRHYLRRVEQIPSLVTRTLLLLSINLAGQRPSQLARVKKENLDFSAPTVLIFDPKGKRTSGPRQHILPLTRTSADLFKPLMKLESKEGYLFSSDGKTLIRPETVSIAIRAVCDEMLKNGEARSAFQMRDIRRTCETMLAAMGITREVRAQLQSHGLGGIQNRHYDRHHYMDEKLAALKAWEKKLKALSKHQ